MKPLLILAQTLTVLLLLEACDNEEVNTARNYFMFGRFYGECHQTLCAPCKDVAGKIYAVKK
jgi:hypothetical protein